MKQLIASLLIFAGIAAGAAEPPEIEYHDLTGGFPVLGTLCPDAAEVFTRLPDSLQSKVRRALWNLGLNSAGISVRFRSDSPRLKAKWHSRNKFAMNHMTATGVRGLDLYVMQPDSSWTTVCSARPSLSSATSISSLVSDMEPGVMREYMLYLSLYDGVDSLWIGVDEGCKVLAPAVDLPKAGKPVVMYGTSILQGGCATRPGMAHTNILQRRLQREVVNLGFSGNARLDPEIAQFMASADAACFVLDPLPNCTSEQLRERLPRFVDILRAGHPETPILLVESPMFPISRFNREVKQTLTEKNRVFRELYHSLKEKYPNIFYFESEKTLLYPEATVDNYHYTDSGFSDFARELEPVLLQIIGNGDAGTHKSAVQSAE